MLSLPFSKVHAVAVLSLLSLFVQVAISRVVGVNLLAAGGSPLFGGEGPRPLGRLYAKLGLARWEIYVTAMVKR
jgi:hypothetical protein